MKLICTKENLKKAIFNTERVVSKQTTLPILNNFLFETEKGMMKISATNLEIGIISKIPAKIEIEGKVTVPARITSNFIGNLSTDENVNIETKDNQDIKIKSGNSRAIIKGLSAEEFPLIPQKSTEHFIKFAGSEFKKIISKIINCVSFSEARQELTGINLIIEKNNLFFAATDSFRLAEVRKDINDKEINKLVFDNILEKNNNLIIPASTLVELMRIIPNDENSDISVFIEEGQIFFEIDGTSIVSRLINGKYPEYRHIMPKNFETTIIGEKKHIFNATKMAAGFSSSKTNEVDLISSTEESKIIIEAKNSELGENSSTIKLDVVGPDQKITLNHKYLIDGINNIESGKIAILANNETTPIALKEVGAEDRIIDNYTYIIMPIKN